MSSWLQNSSFGKIVDFLDLKIGCAGDAQPRLGGAGRGYRRWFFGQAGGVLARRPRPQNFSSSIHLAEAEARFALRGWGGGGSEEPGIPSRSGIQLQLHKSYVVYKVSKPLIPLQKADFD